MRTILTSTLLYFIPKLASQADTYFQLCITAYTSARIKTPAVLDSFVLPPVPFRWLYINKEKKQPRMIRSNKKIKW